jgi:hypothetical protein
MTKYRVSFIGRTAGAIGITYPIVAEVEAASEEEARLKLYDRYEWILFPKFEVIG